MGRYLLEVGNRSMKTACLFPGQGAQKVGMGAEHYSSNPTFANTMDEANDILGYDLKEIMFAGPVEKLKQTKYTQPAIFVHSVGLFSTLQVKPDMVAGHSLGEFSALVACNALSFTDALKIVDQRGRLMQKAGEENPGTMAAIIGMKDEQVKNICKSARNEIGSEVVAANFNCPGQVVISGDVEAVDKAIEIAKEQGCRLAKKLTVSGAFHSSLMQPAYEGLKEQLQQLEIENPDCPIYANYTARPTTEPEKIRESLLDQLLNPVRWTETMIQMKADGASKFMEVGPGRVLQGLVKRTLNEVEIEGYE